MALTNSNELQNRLSNLKRAPVPKLPTEKPDHFKTIKLRPTKVDAENETENTEEETPSISNGPKKERSLSVKERLKDLEGSPAPGIKPKPVIGVKPGVKPVVKPVVRAKPAALKNDEATHRQPSVINKPSPGIPLEYKDTRIPEENTFPPLKSLGHPPAKPPKLWSLKKSLEKYIGTTHPPRPTPTKIISENDTGPSIDAPVIPARPKNKPKDPEVIQEKPVNGVVDENGNSNDDGSGGIYDDTMASGEGGIYDDTVASDEGGIYDDTVAGGEDGVYDDTVDNADQENGTQLFGDDIYEPITGVEEEEYEVLPADNGSHTEKKTKEQVKEDKKKKEKEEKEKRKKEKEEKEKKEKEKKKREKEMDKKNSEMKRKFSVRGNEASLGPCCAAADIVGNKWDITASIGETFDIIRKDKPNPANKWLVRNQLGQYGFINIVNVEGEQGESEDLYEDVNAVKQSMSTLEEDFPAAPTMAPPPPPNRNPAADDQEIYDDVTADEELYEPLDN